MSEEITKTRRIEGEEDELRPEYDLSELLKGGVRGKYAERYRAGTNLVMLEPDVARAFPNDETVNEALRLVMQISKLQVGTETTRLARSAA